MPIVCVAVVGRTNNPLYLRAFDAASLRFQYIVHTSLDIVEEKLRVASKSKTTAASGATGYLGLLYPTEEFKVYGYITNTKVKFIVVAADDGETKDAAIGVFFKKFHQLYVNTISNPFRDPEAKIESSRFDEAVVAMVNAQS